MQTTTGKVHQSKLEKKAETPHNWICLLDRVSRSFVFKDGLSTHTQSSKLMAMTSVLKSSKHFLSSKYVFNELCHANHCFLPF